MPTPIQYFLRDESGTITEIKTDLLVGRSEACDLVITDGHPSRQHAKITLEDNTVFIEDLGSANGTFINRSRIHEKRALHNGDSLALGLFQMDFYTEGDSSTDTTQVHLVDPNQTAVQIPDITNTSDIPARFALLGQDQEELISFHQTIVIGRDTSRSEHVGLIIENMGVSSLHAELEPSPDGVLVTDLESANGTYLNDTRITEPTLAKYNDRLRFHLIEVILFDREARDLEPKPTDTENSAAEVDPNSEENSYLESGDVAAKGGTVMMPISPAIPPAWLESSGAGTVVVNAAELQQMNAEQYKHDAARLEETVDAPTLLILSGQDAGRPYKLEAANEVNFWNIGRNSEKHDLSIVIDDASVSDFHAKLVCRQDRWQIIDQMSTNSVYVNGKRHSSAYLASTDRVRIGRVETMLLIPRQESAEPPPKTGGIYARILRWLGIQ